MREKIVSVPKAILKLPKKILIPLILVVLVGGWYLLTPKTAQTPQEFIKVERKDLQATLSASGTLTGKQLANLKFRSPGKLAYLKVKPGDSVKAGQTLAGLDTQDLNISLQQALNTYRDKQAIAQKIEDDLKDHTSDETLTQKQTRTTAQAARDSAYDTVKAAQRAFQDAVVVAPFDGVVVSQADIAPGQNISTADLVAQIVDFSEKVFSADVDESDISKVHLDQPVEITLNAYGDQIFQGKVIEITPQTKTSSSGATTITVKVAINSEAIHSIFGLNGQANIITSQAKHVLAIPLEALGDDDQVVVKQGDATEVKKVTLGLQSDDEVEITSGLTDNDQVLKNPQSRINQRSQRSPFSFIRLNQR